MARVMGWVRIAGLDKDYFTRWPQLIDAVTAAAGDDAAKSTLSRVGHRLLLPEEERQKP